MRISPEFIRHLTAVSQSIAYSHFRFSGIEGGGHTVLRLGDGTEFAEHQSYSLGDDPRYLDWKLYARRSSLQIKKFYPDVSRMIYLFLDTSGSMDYGNPQKFDYAVRLAAGIAFLSLRGFDTINILTGNTPKGEALLGCRHLSSFPRPIHFLESLKPCGKDTDLLSCWRFMTNLHLPPGPIWIFSDFYDIAPWKDSLQFLRFHHFLPLPVRITAPEEFCFPHRGDLTLVDLETSRQKQIHITKSLRREYENHFQHLSSQIRHAARSAGIQLKEISTDFSAEKFLLQLVQNNR